MASDPPVADRRPPAVAHVAHTTGLFALFVDCIGGPGNPPARCTLGLTADLDGDGDVDLTDFGYFADCLGGPDHPPAPACSPGVDADLDADGDVDLRDFAVFARTFTGSE